MTTTQTDRLASVSSLAIKAPCVAATTANITLSGLQTVDGVTLVESDRVLVKDQTDAKENGIWLASSSAWQRASDFDGAYDVTKGTIVRVTGGSTSLGRTFFVAGNYTIGTDNISFRPDVMVGSTPYCQLDYFPNVKSGDSTFDNSPGIAAALTALASSGLTLFIPGGTWYIATDLILTDNMRVVCADTAIIQHRTGTTPQIHLRGSSHLTTGWRGGRVNGQDDSDSASVAFIVGNASSDVNPAIYVDNVRFGSGLYDGVSFVAESDCSEITNCRASSDFGRAWIYGDIPSSNSAPSGALRITGNHIAGQNSRTLGKSKYGIFLKGFSVGGIDDNIINGFDTCICIVDDTSVSKSTESLTARNLHTEDFRPFVNDPVARANSTAYTVGTERNYNGYVFTCTVAGTSAGSPPTFTYTIGATTVDGTVTWQCVSRHSPRWTAARVVTVGELVKPTKDHASRYTAVWQCTTGGTTGGSEPAAWGTEYGDTVNDNGVVWTLVAKSVGIFFSATNRRTLLVDGYRSMNHLVQFRLEGKARINVRNLAQLASSQGDIDNLLSVGTITENISATFEDCQLRGNLQPYNSAPSSPTDLVCQTMLKFSKLTGDSVGVVCPDGDGIYSAYIGLIAPAFVVNSKAADYSVDWKKDAVIRCNHTSPITITVGSPNFAQRGHVVTIQNSVEVPVKIDLTGMACNFRGKATTTIWLTRRGELVKLRALSANNVEIDGDSLIALNYPNSKQLFDEFLGLSIDTTKWQTTLGTDPQCAVTIPEESGGTIRLATGDDAGGTMALNGVQLNSALNWHANAGGLSFEARIQPSTNGNVAIFCGFTDQRAALEMPFTLGAGDALTSNASDAVGFLYDSAADNDYIYMVGVKADADATKQNNGAALSSVDWTLLRLEIASDGSARFFINDALVGTKMDNAVTASALLTPVIAVFSRSATGKSLYVGRIRVTQD